MAAEKEIETDEESKKEDEPVKEDAPWIQRFMKSTQYNILGNEGGGDCLFISTALASVGINKSVAILEIFLPKMQQKISFRL